MAKNNERLSREMVDRIAALAQLELSEAEIERFQQQLTDVFAHFQQLSEVDTSELLADERATILPQELRADVADEPLTPAAALANAPEQEAGQFRVPAILPQED